MSGIFGIRTAALSMKEAQAELAKDPSILLLDVRTSDEYRSGHIPGSIHIPLDRLPEQIGQKVPDKTARLFVYCLSGGRSSQACGWLRQNGYANVTNIGGISSWPGPVVRD